MKNLTLATIAQACGGKLVVPQPENAKQTEKEVSCVVIDSRKIQKDGVFIATKGERVDGHDFISQVIQAGAIGVVCERLPEKVQVPCVLVQDSFQALRDIAEFYRLQLTIPVIGITGSVGKTSTKEVIAAVLGQKYKVCKTQGNFNNEIGLPLTVLSIQPEHQAAVVEMGINHFGEMYRLSKIARPDICVITNIGECHLENLGSKEGILKEKTEIFAFMNPDGLVFLNGEDDLLNTVTKPGKQEIIRFGYRQEHDIYATDIEDRGLLGSAMKVHIGKETFDAGVTLPGVHMILNALAAAGIGKKLGLTVQEITKGMQQASSVAGRSHVIKTGRYTIIDDCYNANPVSMKASLNLLSTALDRKVAILGDMFELGEQENDLHGEIGAYVAEHAIDELICIGSLSRWMFEKACEKCEEQGRTSAWIHYFATKEEAVLQLPTILHQDDAILIKASHGMHFEQLVAMLQKESEL